MKRACGTQIHLKLNGAFLTNTNKESRIQSHEGKRKKEAKKNATNDDFRRFKTKQKSQSYRLQNLKETYPLDVFPYNALH